MAPFAEEGERQETVKHSSDARGIDPGRRARSRSGYPMSWLQVIQAFLAAEGDSACFYADGEFFTEVLFGFQGNPRRTRRQIWRLA
jgi:hypothetical protein